MPETQNTTCALDESGLPADERARLYAERKEHSRKRNRWIFAVCAPLAIAVNLSWLAPLAVAYVKVALRQW